MADGREWRSEVGDVLGNVFSRLISLGPCGKVQLEMRFWNWFRSIFTWRRKTVEFIAVLARGEAALTRRVDELAELHADLVRQIAIQQAETAKQLADIRAIVTQLGKQAKVKPTIAGNMAEIRRFMGDTDE